MGLDLLFVAVPIMITRPAWRRLGVSLLAAIAVRTPRLQEAEAAAAVGVGLGVLVRGCGAGEEGVVVKRVGTLLVEGGGSVNGDAGREFTGELVDGVFALHALGVAAGAFALLAGAGKRRRRVGRVDKDDGAVLTSLAALLGGERVGSLFGRGALQGLSGSGVVLAVARDLQRGSHARQIEGTTLWAEDEVRVGWGLGRRLFHGRRHDGGGSSAEGLEAVAKTGALLEACARGRRSVFATSLFLLDGRAPLRHRADSGMRGQVEAAGPRELLRGRGGG